jgi:hypothetical protein
MNKVICREKELSRIKTRLASESTEFIVVYGRRRVGKTWLVRNAIPMLLDQDNYVYLEVTGTISDDSRLLPSKESFYNSLNLSWNISFGELLFDPSADSRNMNIENLFFLKLSEKIHSFKKQKIILFFDELPWIAKTSKTFYDGILFFRNNAVRDNKNIKIFVSGSATSWMLDNIVNAKGSAALRATEIIKLYPLTLFETSRYLFEKCKMSCSNEIVYEIYLCIGGIPYYLDYVNPQKTWVENLYSLTSTETGLLNMDVEHDKIFSILFEKPQFHKKVVDYIATSRYGKTVMEISQKIIFQKKSNGKISKTLRELVACDILEKREQLFHKSKQAKYFIKDNFLNFYYKWLNRQKQIKLSSFTDLIHSSAYRSWCGIMFELILFTHHKMVMRTLGYQKLAYETFLYHYEKNKSKRQIDLIIVLPRLRTLIICEAKYRINYELSKADIDSAYEKKQDIHACMKRHKKSYEVKICYITKTPLKKNRAYQELLPLEMTFDQVFKSED